MGINRLKRFKKASKIICSQARRNNRYLRGVLNLYTYYCCFFTEQEDYILYRTNSVKQKHQQSLKKKNILRGQWLRLVVIANWFLLAH